MKTRVSIAKKINSKGDFKKFYASIRENHPKVVPNYGLDSQDRHMSCGCDGDCCGHLTRLSYNNVDFKRKNGVVYAIVTHEFYYNH